ncbi:MAG: protein-(glutamine-N5) methyltransferase, release factor-specific [Firmicutes bacterium RBG_13_65_8]|nr:MAG: protein-(glutamine-N5) methyltransferase, release factor-specific [Firmicutes bacterium RBG_13_65_8]
MGRPETWSSLLAAGAARLREASVERPRLEAELLLSHILGLRREDLLSSPETRAGRGVGPAFARALERRCGGEPLAYIVGHKEFMSLDFAVSREVLVPRPETELLVETAAAFLSGRAAPRAVELGAGSGAVGISLARMLPALQLWAVDISPGAVRIAVCNAEAHGVAGRVRILVGDLLSAAGLPGPGTVDAVIGNLPYVPAGVFGRLAPEVAVFEPRIALDGGPDGLAVISRLLPQAARYLPPGGACGLECDPGQCTLLTELYRQAGFCDVVVHSDLAGRARVVWGVVGGQGDRGQAGSFD